PQGEHAEVALCRLVGGLLAAATPEEREEEVPVVLVAAVGEVARIERGEWEQPRVGLAVGATHPAERPQELMVGPATLLAGRCDLVVFGGGTEARQLRALDPAVERADPEVRAAIGGRLVVDERP